MFFLLLIFATSEAATIGNCPAADPDFHNLDFFSPRTTIVHLFEWNWNDIKAECAGFLKENGYGAVQISPPNEHAKLGPWWESYQPVSYKLQSRRGTEMELREMISVCNSNGVRIIADAVINHMTGGGKSGTGTAGSSYDGSTLEYPGVPYHKNDFNEFCDQNSNSCCNHEIENYKNSAEVRNCRLVSLHDLAIGKPEVRQKIVNYLNRLTEIGVAGFRIDAAKHMWPADLQQIYNSLHELNPAFFQTRSRPFIFQEVIDEGGEGISKNEYTCDAQKFRMKTRVTEFSYGKFLTDAVYRNPSSFGTPQNFRYFGDIGESWGLLNQDFTLTFVDNHDNQRDGNRVTYKDSRRYKIAVGFMLAHPYGIPQVMSSFKFENRDDPPPASAACFKTNVCEHRWRQIKNMVGFRNFVGAAPLQKLYNSTDHRIGFARGNKGFFLLNNHPTEDLRGNFQTGLPRGIYCDIISGDLVNGICAGNTLTINGAGEVENVCIPAEKRAAPLDQFIALRSDLKPSGNVRRTLIFIKKQTGPGKTVGIRGNAGGLSWNSTKSMTLVNRTEELNVYGDNYWKLVLDIDCSALPDGKHFEFKGFSDQLGGFEPNPGQGSTCGGCPGDNAGPTTQNHWGLCGKVNVVEWGSGTCTINNF